MRGEGKEKKGRRRREGEEGKEKKWVLFFG